MFCQIGLKNCLLLIVTMALVACGEQSNAEIAQAPLASPKAVHVEWHSAGEQSPRQADKQPIKQLTFTDARLADCVTATAQTKGWQSVDEVTELSCPNKSISSLGGIQNLLALTSLSLQQNDIEQLAPLAKLTALQTLNLADNRLVSIESLSGLDKLRRLSLANEHLLNSPGNSIRNIEPLGGLLQLESLNLANNQVSDVSALKGLQQLRQLTLDGNQVREIRALLDLTQTAQVDLTGNNNITCAELNDLETQLIDGRLVRPYDCIFTLDILITDIRFPDAKLRSCVLDSASNEGWITIGEVTELACDAQQLNDLTGLENLKAISKLDLSGNQFIDISPLFDLTNTAEISLSGNPQVACARLDALDAVLGSGVVVRPGKCSPITLISDLEFVDPVLESCVRHSATGHQWRQINQMTELRCAPHNRSKIKDLRGIEQLTALSRIDLSSMLAADNGVVDLTPLFYLPRGVSIDLAGLVFPDCRELDALADTLNAKVTRPTQCQQ